MKGFTSYQKWGLHFGCDIYINSHTFDYLLQFICKDRCITHVKIQHIFSDFNITVFVCVLFSFTCQPNFKTLILENM